MLLCHAWKLLRLKDMPHVIVDVIIDDSSSTMDFNVAKIVHIVKKSSIDDIIVTCGRAFRIVHVCRS